MMESAEAITPTALVRSLLERLNDRDADSLGVFYAEDVVETWPVIGRLEGRKAVQDQFGEFFAAMPDFHVEIERMAAEGETVFAHWHLTGTLTGAPFHGIDATGRAIDLRGTDCFTVRDGKVVAGFVAYDGITFAVQAGILPPFGSPLGHVMTFATNVMTCVANAVGRRVF
jgi:steroid delta-isomerase-like uncharacterized protein